ncbi:MAG: glycosyltransferase family protein [Gammaproteobacteria bacterium]
MRILHVAHFDWFVSRSRDQYKLGRYYSTDCKINNGLIRNGHCVRNLSERDSARNLAPMIASKKLGKGRLQHYFLQVVDAVQPDLIILGHSYLLEPRTLAQLRATFPACRIAQWWVDDFASHKVAALRELQPHLDAFFATTAPAYYRQYFEDSSTALYYLPNIVDSSVETGRAFAASSHRYDLFFAGSNNLERAQFLQLFEQDASIRTGFFGFGNQETLSGPKLASAIEASKFGLNLSQHTQIPLYSSDRLSQLAGNGVLVCTPETPDMKAVISDKEAVYFKDAADLQKKLHRYLEDDTHWRAIAEAGWNRVHRCYNEQRITKFMIEAAMADPFSEDYPWLEYAISP